ncbi:MAG: hypothetical protein K6E70_02250 [Butyrivibrio sp.]|jgi:hypothetical protein|nr:hypothetical protein [Butyrivibrio sp.]
MRKVLKSLAGIALACAITFTAMPQTAHAVSYSASKLNTNASAGGSYTIKTYFPGIGYQKLKVRFDSITKDYYLPYLYNGMLKKATVEMHVSVPKSTQNKIKHNTVKIVRSSKHRWDDIMCGCYLIDATTGCAYNNSNAAGKVRYAYGYSHNKEWKTFRQTSGYYRATYYLDTSWDTSYEVQYYTANEGNMLLGVAGTKKEVTKNSSKVTNFANGNAPITSSAFFKNKMKKLSIWTRL